MTTLTIMVGLLVAPLLFGAALNRFAGRTVANVHLLGCVGITLVFCFTGVGHFILTDQMAEMLPSWAPGRIPLVYVTGVIEIAAAVAVLIPRLRTTVGWGLIVMLILFLPVNVYAAMNRVEMGGHQWGPNYLLIRVPLQFILVGWIWWIAVRPSASHPIKFSCETTLPLNPEKIASQILDLSRWPEFNGYGPLPGIKQAEFETKTAEIVGTRIRVTNRDSSTHVEEIVEWEPTRCLRLHMHEFSPPVSRLAISFDEAWQFERDGDLTHVVRSFEMHPRSALTRPLLWLISFLLKRAIGRHLEQMQNTALKE